MSIKMLNKMVVYLPKNDPLTPVIRGLMAYGHATGFRGHNYVITRRKGYGKLKNLYFYPNVDKPTHLLVHLPYAKTHQLNNPSPESRTLKCVCAQGDLCAVHEMAALVGKRYKDGRHRNRAIFLLPDGSPVEYHHLKHILKTLCILF